ncbi:MAG TPA: thiamine pyrophosphate-dependent enzyme [Chthonomonadaceae bacterium]|nr:thiamine pyrophosphate-dependent enzyme [Chthonomonadaceae bacterium]
MAVTAGDILVESLLQWGVDTIFGIPGDGINGVMEALRKRQDQIRFIQVRHEESAAFMACGYAKWTGRLGVCLATSGPGGIHLLNGLYDAKMDRQPVLAITGHHYHDLIDTYAQQDVNLDYLFKDVALYSARVMGAAHVENVTHLACRTALTHRGVAAICIPTDIQDFTLKDDDRSKRNLPHHESVARARRSALPAEDALELAAEILNGARKPVLLVGQGALEAQNEVEQLAERLGAPVVKALLGKAVLPDASPYTTGGLGLLGTRPSQEAMEECDTLFIVGSSFPYVEFYPKPGEARAVQLDIDPARIGLRYPVEIGLVGAARATLQALLPWIRRNEDRSFLEKAQKGMAEWRERMERGEERDDRPMKPQTVVREFGLRLTDNAIIAADSGTNTTWAARQIDVKRDQMFSCSGTLASMACGLPYALAAQAAYPDRQCVAVVGDGGFSMLMAEFATAVKYDLPVKILVIKNNTLGQIKWEQIVFLGNPEFAVELQPIDFAGFARCCGGSGFTIEDAKDCGRILDQALGTAGPVVIEAVVDPLEPPMPPKIQAEQALHLAEALLRGEPNREKIALTAVSEGVRELV